MERARIMLKQGLGQEYSVAVEIVFEEKEEEIKDNETKNIFDK